jgi:tetratricopeptide (TPR) repeat protein
VGSSSVFGFALAPGTDFGPRYHIEAVLGEGGMGAVYKAFDRDLERTVAIKLLRPGLMADPVAIQRFKQELLLASKISHKNILRIHDLGDVEGVKFISMAFVDGEDLHHALRKTGRLPLDRVLKIIRQLCGALEAAHAEGVVHRDLKPQNVMIDQGDNAYITDFGLAKSLEAGAAGMTRAGEYLGTPRYMSPEQVEGKPLDNRSDLYSLGLIMYEMLTGDVPFTSDSTIQLMFQRVKQKPKDPRELNPEIPEYLARVILRCLEKDPKHRYQHAKEILADLDTEHASSARSLRITLPVPETKKGWMVFAGAGVAVIVLLALAFPFLRSGISRLTSGPAPGEQAPVSVLVADFTNQTGDPILDGTLEPMLNLALEGANFISAFNRGNARQLAQRLPQPTDKLDEQAARLVAVGQGISAVITGNISRRGESYSISAVALDAVSGEVIAKAEVTAANKDEVLLAIPKLVAPLRKGLGDTTPESAQIEKAQGAFTAASLEVVHQYGIAVEQLFAGKMEEALKSFSNAVELDPKFARAYVGMAAAYGNLGQAQEAEKHVKLAMEHVDRMTERERYRIRGFYYYTTENWQKCVEEYTELVERYHSDNVGQGNLAGCYLHLRKFPEAVAAAKKAVEIVPKGALQRAVLSLYSSSNGDYATAEREARTALEISPSYPSYLALVKAQVGLGQLAEAAETYQKLEQFGPVGKAVAASGLADLAMYGGRFAEAARILEQGAAADLAAKNTDAAALKFATLAHIQLLRGQKGPAVASAAKAVGMSQAVPVRVLAGLAFAESGDTAKAQPLAEGLAAETQAESQAFAKIIEGEVALARGDKNLAIKSLTEANQLLDTWLGRFKLGRAYLEAGQFVEADSEFDRCIKRRGEALVLFMNHVPTIGFFPPVYYYQGRVREGLKSPGFAEPFRTYLDIRGKAGEDPLIPDIRLRMGER